jgi:hypothetical protein
MFSMMRFMKQASINLSLFLIYIGQEQGVAELMLSVMQKPDAWVLKNF